MPLEEVIIKDDISSQLSPVVVGKRFVTHIFTYPQIEVVSSA